MNPFLYLINPANDFPAYYGAEVLGELGLQRTAFVADLATVTVAVLAPADFRIEICDENVSPADLKHPAELVGITGKAIYERIDAYSGTALAVDLGARYLSCVINICLYRVLDRSDQDRPARITALEQKVG